MKIYEILVRNSSKGTRAIVTVEADDIVLAKLRAAFIEDAPYHECQVLTVIDDQTQRALAF
jgi:hypothetical protein